MNSILSTHRWSLSFLSLWVSLLVSPIMAASDDESDTAIAYYELKPSFVSNLTGGPKYIRCDIQLMTKRADEIAKIALHSPALRHSILMLLAGQDGKQLMSREGKESLRQEALQSVRTRLEQLSGDAIVDDLYFTAYYVK